MTFVRQKINDLYRNINWELLIFLIVVLDVKMVVKITGLLVFLILNKRLFRDKNIFRQKFLWFYAGMIVIGLVNVLINFTSLSANYSVTASVGIAFWLMCII